MQIHIYQLLFVCYSRSNLTSFITKCVYFVFTPFMFSQSLFCLYHSCQKGHSPIHLHYDKEFSLTLCNYIIVSYTYTIDAHICECTHIYTLTSIVVTLYDNDFPCEFVYLMWMYNKTTYISLAQRYFNTWISGLYFIMR